MNLHFTKQLIIGSSLLVTAAAASAAPSFHRAVPIDPPPLAVELSGGVDVLNLNGATFTGTGRTPGSSAPVAVSASAKQLGLIQPIVANTSLHALIGHGHFAFGGRVGLLLAQNTPQPSSLAFSGSTIGYLVGPEALTHINHGPFELRAGISLGLRLLNVEMLGLVPDHCGTGRCYPTVTLEQFFVEPQASANLHVSKHTTVGAYAGTDIMSAGSWSGGALLTASSASWRKDARIDGRLRSLFSRRGAAQ